MYLLNLYSYAVRQDGDPNNHYVITRPTSKTDDGLRNFAPHGTAPNILMDRDLASHSEIISDISADEMKKRYFKSMFVSITILTYTFIPVSQI